MPSAAGNASNLNPNCQKLVKKYLLQFLSINFNPVPSSSFFCYLYIGHPQGQKKSQLPWCGTRSYCAEALIGVTPRLHGSTPHASQHAIHQLLTVQELLGKRVVDYAQSVSHRWIIHFFAPKYALCNKSLDSPTNTPEIFFGFKHSGKSEVDGK